MKPKHTFRGVVMRTDVSRPRALTQAPQIAPAQARVRVGREVAGRSGKGVSVVTGLPLDAAGLETLATRLKKLCGAGGAVKGATIDPGRSPGPARN